MTAGYGVLYGTGPAGTNLSRAFLVSTVEGRPDPAYESKGILNLFGRDPPVSEFAQTVTPLADGALVRLSRVDAEDLVEACDFEDGADGFLKTGESEGAAILLDVLHPFDEGGEPGAVDVADPCKIDNQLFRLFLDHHVERLGEVRRDVQIDLAFEREHVGSIFTWHGAGGRRGFLTSQSQPFTSRASRSTRRHRKNRRSKNRADVSPNPRGSIGRWRRRWCARRTLCRRRCRAACRR